MDHVMKAPNQPKQQALFDCSTDRSGFARSVHFMSEKDDWETPQFLFDGLSAEFGSELDVCATMENAKCRHYFSPEDDGLSKTWEGVCWMNPPYGREIGRWMEKALLSAKEGTAAVCLVPARTDTAWWHRFAMRREVPSRPAKVWQRQERSSLSKCDCDISADKMRVAGAKRASYG